MPVVNPLARELIFKVVYYGPGLGGKTSTLQHIHATAKPEHRGKMVSLATPVDRTLYFDFLPIRVPHVRGLGVRLQLFTVPGQVHFNATRKLVLTGADAVVLVFDSQRARADANVETLENLHENLGAHGKSLRQVPHVIQYNKRDLHDAVEIDELERSFNRYGAPSFATVATSGEGVYEALEAITRSVLEDFERRVPESRALERTSLELPEGGLVEALRRAESAEEDAPMPRAVPREDSPLSRLSEVPEEDPGEAAARAVTAHVTLRVPGTPSSADAAPDASGRPQSHELPSAKPFSFAALFPPSERETVRSVETALAAGESVRALSGIEQLMQFALENAAPLARSPKSPGPDPALVLLLLGIDGRRYFGFRALLQRAEAGEAVSLEVALHAYALALELRHALHALR